MNKNQLKYLACGGSRKDCGPFSFLFSDSIKKKKENKKTNDLKEKKDNVEEEKIADIIEESKNMSEKKFKSDLDLAIGLSLSEQFQLTEKESEQLVNSDICEKSFKNEEITTVSELDDLVKASIISFGGNKVLPNQGGGNCLFHTLSTHLNISHQQLRQDSIDYLTINWNKFKDFALRSDTLEPFDSMDDYKKYMSKEDSWGDHLSLLSLCELYQINAIIIVTNGNRLSEPIKINVGSTRTVLIKFTSEFHYEAIV